MLAIRKCWICLWSVKEQLNIPISLQYIQICNLHVLMVEWNCNITSKHFQVSVQWLQNFCIAIMVSFFLGFLLQSKLPPMMWCLTFLAGTCSVLRNFKLLHTLKIYVRRDVPTFSLIDAFLGNLLGYLGSISSSEKWGEQCLCSLCSLM